MPDWRSLAFWGILTGVWVAGVWGYLEGVVFSGVTTPSFQVAGRTFEVLAPEWLGMVLVVPVLFIVARFGLSDLPRAQRAVNLGLRAVLVALIAAALSQVVVTDFDSRVAAVYLVDVSKSMPDEALEQSLDHVNEAVDGLGEDDRLEVIAFADRPVLVEPGEDGYYDELPRPGEGDAQFDTDISAALQMAYGLFPDDHLRRAVLLTDGNETHGDALAQFDRADDYGIRVSTRALDYERPPEVMIRGIEAPDEVTAGAGFRLAARIHSTHEDTVDLELWRDEYRHHQRTVDVEPGVTEVQFEAEISEPGFREFRLEMEVHGEDTHDENNVYVHSIHVGGPPRLLYVEGEMRARHHFERALNEAGYDVDTRSPTGLPGSAEQLEQFDLVVLSDVHAGDVSSNQMQLLDDYVRGGGGLLKAGGENSFGPGGWEHTSVEELMPVTFRGRERIDEPEVAILLVIDRSGSMEEHRRMELAREAARAAVRELDDHAEIGIMAFDHEVTPIAPIQPVTNRARIIDQIDGIRIRGGTDIALALEEAYDEMAFHPARVRHVILLTDGISPEDNIFTETMPAMRVEGITVTTVAVGDGAETSLMRRIADAGDGRFYFTNRPDEIPRIFVDETTAVAESALVEEPVGVEVVGQSPVIAGIDWHAAPFLLGYTSTTPRADADVLLNTDRGEPLVATRRVGLGNTAVFTSDVKSRWASRWVRWEGYPQLFAQLARRIKRTDDRRYLAMDATVERADARVVVDGHGPDGRFVNDLDSRLEVTTPEGETVLERFEQTAPGRYETTFELDGFGAYELTAEHRLDGEEYATSRTSLSYPYPRGLAFAEPNTGLLERGAEITGGTLEATTDEIFDPDGEQIPHRRHLWPYLAALAALLVVIDLGFRRIRLGGETEVSWEQLVR